jgi:hypothetical protein
MANDTTNQVGLSLFGQGGSVYENIDTSKTLALADNGIVQNVIADGITITLPATTAGACFTIRNGGVPASSAVGAGTGGDASALITIAPNSVDQIAGLNFTAADNKAALNTKATSKVGDFITLVGDGTNGWNVLYARGTWARQA